MAKVLALILLLILLLMSGQSQGQHLINTGSKHGLFKMANDSTFKSGTSHGFIVKIEKVRYLPFLNRYYLRGKVVDASKGEVLPDFTIYHGIRTTKRSEFKLYKKWEFKSIETFRIRLKALPNDLLIFDTTMPFSAEEYTFNAR